MLCYTYMFGCYDERVNDEKINKLIRFLAAKYNTKILIFFCFRILSKKDSNKYKVKS